MAARAAARTTALRPGASPPPVVNAMRRMGLVIGSLQLGPDLFPGGMPLGGFLRVDQLAIGRDLEDAALRLDQLDPGVRKLAFDLGLQPGGAREVVSHPAVFD